MIHKIKMKTMDSDRTIVPDITEIVEKLNDVIDEVNEIRHEMCEK